MPESLSAFSASTSWSNKTLHQTASLVSPMFVRHWLQLSVTEPYKLSEKPKAECAMENYMKKYFTSMSVFLPHALPESVYALNLYFSGLQSLLSCMLSYF